MAAELPVLQVDSIQTIQDAGLGRTGVIYDDGSKRWVLGTGDRFVTATRNNIELQSKLSTPTDTTYVKRHDDFIIQNRFEIGQRTTSVDFELYKEYVTLQLALKVDKLIDVYTIVQGQAKDDWENGKLYCIQDTAGSFAGSNALYQYFAFGTIKPGTAITALSINGYGYVKTITSAPYPSQCRLSYDVVADKWYSCYDPALNLEGSASLGTELNKIDWGRWDNSTIIDSVFFSINVLNVVTKSYLKNAFVTWDNTLNTQCNISGSTVNGGFGASLNFMHTYASRSITFSESRMEASGTYYAYTGCQHCIIGISSTLTDNPLSLGSDTVADTTIDNGVTLDLSTGDNGVEVLDCTILGNKVISPLTAQTGKSWIGEVSSFENASLPYDIAGSATIDLTAFAYCGDVYLTNSGPPVTVTQIDGLNPNQYYNFHPDGTLTIDVGGNIKTIGGGSMDIFGANGDTLAAYFDAFFVKVLYASNY